MIPRNSHVTAVYLKKEIAALEKRLGIYRGMLALMEIEHDDMLSLESARVAQCDYAAEFDEYENEL